MSVAWKRAQQYVHDLKLRDRYMPDHEIEEHLRNQGISQGGVTISMYSDGDCFGTFLKRRPIFDERMDGKLRQLAEKRGLIVETDSMGRNFCSNHKRVATIRGYVTSTDPYLFDEILDICHVRYLTFFEKLKRYLGRLKSYLPH